MDPSTSGPSAPSDGSSPPQPSSPASPSPSSISPPPSPASFPSSSPPAGHYTPPPPPGAFGAPQPGYNYPTVDRRSNNHGIVWLFVGLAIVAAAFVVLGVAVGSNDDNDEQTSAPTVAPATDGDVFVDPGGKYSLTIGPDWVQVANDGTTEAWTVGAEVDGLKPVVTATSQVEPGLSLKDLLDLDGEDLGDDVKVVDSGIVKSATGEELARLEYVGTLAGDIEVRYLSFIEVSGALTNSVTLTSPADQFESARKRVEPYMLTLTTE